MIASYGNTLMDPEGGYDTAWITESGYNTLHYYSMDYVTAIDSGNPKKIESEFREYHDSVVEAVAIGFDGRFMAIGSNAEVRGWMSPNTKIIDLHGHTATPGLIDSGYQVVSYTLMGAILGAWH